MRIHPDETHLIVGDAFGVRGFHEALHTWIGFEFFPVEPVYLHVRSVLIRSFRRCVAAAHAFFKVSVIFRQFAGRAFNTEFSVFAHNAEFLR